MSISDKCRVHGGKTPVGIGSPHFKTGRYSKSLPSQLSKRFETAKADDDLFQLRDEIALIDTYLSERLEKLYAGESRDLWLVSKTLLADYKRVLKEYDEESKEPEIDPKDILTRLESVIDKGMTVFGVYEQVQPMIEQRRKLVESEARRLKELQQNITAEKAFTIIHLLADIVRRHVTDRKQRDAISAELASAVN